MSAKTESRINRKTRIRKTLSGTAERPRLTVYKSLKHISAQVIDDETGKTLASASSTGKDFKSKTKGDKVGDKKAVAKAIGMMVAEKCKAASIEKVVFDRNGFPYHGRIAAVADGAREGGLKF